MRRTRTLGVCLVSVSLAMSGAAVAEQGARGQQSQKSATGEPTGPGQGQQQQGSEIETAAGAEPSSAEGAASPRGGSDEAIADYSKLSFEQRRHLQEELQRSGYYQGKVDGIVGPKTLEAIKQLQSDIGESQANGALTAMTAQALGVRFDQSGERQPVAGSDESMSGTTEASGESGANMRQQGQSRSATQQMDPAAETVSLSELHNDEIRRLQQRLQEMGLYQGKLDGIVGPQTRSALQRFYSKQAQLAARGELTRDVAVVFDIDATRMPVRGEDEPSSMGDPAMDRPSQGQGERFTGESPTGEPSTGGPADPSEPPGGSSSEEPVMPPDDIKLR